MGTDKEKKHGSFWKKAALVATTAAVTVLAVKNWDSIVDAGKKVGSKVKGKFTKSEGSVEQQPQPEEQPMPRGYNNNNRNNGGYYNKPRN